MFVCPECGAAQPVGGHCGADGARLAPIGEDLLLGTTIGPYRVARLLGIGGMGRVYKGVHPTIGSRVAIKVLSRECSDRRDLVERFFGEARAVNVINHEGIVKCLDLAMLPDGRPYIIMEFLDGCPLASIVESSVQRGTPLPLGGLARMMAEVLDALGAAHAKGIVHRDLKPDNIYVTPSGRPKLLDFGIAKLSETGMGSSTRTGSLLGTPHYMSPEQAAGRPVDLRADIYAIGVILFECATGQKPFTADSLFDLLRKQVEAPPPSPRALRPDLPVALEQVILASLAKAPDERFASTQAMSQALQHATAGLAGEQWAPIVAGTTANLVGGWSPTTPASWGSAPPTQPSPTPPAMTMPSLAQAATMSAGQVTGSAPRSSRRGLWIALGAVLLVGGGVTAAVVAGGGDAGDAGAGSAIAVVSEEQRLVTPPPTAPPAPAPAPDEALAEALDTLEDEIAALPPDVQKRVAALEGLGKLPAADRLAKLGEITRRLDKKLAVELDPVPGGPAPVPVSVPAPTPTPVPAPTPTPAAGAWITSRALQPPGFDARKVDVAKHIAWAIAEARRNVPDAQLTWISVDGARASGRADLTLSASGGAGYLDLRFISPSRSKRDPSVPRGVSVERSCEFRIIASPSGTMLMDMSSFGKCKSVAIAPPRCSLAQVWKKVAAKHADVDEAVAQVVYTSNIVSHKVVWMFRIEEDGESLVSEMFPDDC